MKQKACVHRMKGTFVRVGLVVSAVGLFQAGAFGASGNKSAGSSVLSLPNSGVPTENEGGTADLNAADREARKKMDAIQEKYKEQLLKDGLPLPDNLDIKGDLPQSVMDIIDKLKDEPCEMMNEIKFHLDEKQPRSIAQIAGEAAGIFIVPDHADALEKIAELFAKNLVPVANIYGKFGDAKDIVELLDEEWMANKLHEQHVAAVEAYRASKNWNIDKLNQNVQSLDAECAAKIAEIEKLERELRQKLMREYPTDQEIRVFGPPVVGNLPNNALIWQRYAEKIAPIQRQYEAEIRTKLREVAGIEMKKNALEKFRKPLIEKPCEQCIAEAKKKKTRTSGGGNCTNTGAPLLPPPIGEENNNGAASGKPVNLKAFR